MNVPCKVAFGCSKLRSCLQLKACDDELSKSGWAVPCVRGVPGKRADELRAPDDDLRALPRDRPEGPHASAVERAHRGGQFHPEPLRRLHKPRPVPANPLRRQAPHRREIGGGHAYARPILPQRNPAPVRARVAASDRAALNVAPR